MAIREILLLGNPTLYDVASEVEQDELEPMKMVVDDLHDTMMDFRGRYGYGRAIAAPQIGVKKKLFYMHTDKPAIFINPVIKNASEEMVELWDDCMSFPDLLVKVRRHKKFRLEFRDNEWNECSMDLDGDLSELLQHECDHLAGILAVQRAIDGKSFALRTQKDLLNK